MASRGWLCSCSPLPPSVPALAAFACVAGFRIRLCCTVFRRQPRSPLYLRGDGLGLSWSKGIRMQRTSSATEECYALSLPVASADVGTVLRSSLSCVDAAAVHLTRFSSGAACK